MLPLADSAVVWLWMQSESVRHAGVVCPCYSITCHFQWTVAKKMMLLLMRISSIRRIGLCRWLRYVASPFYFICGYCAWNAWQGSDRVSYPECHKWMTGNLYEMWANKLEYTKIPMYTMHFYIWIWKIWRESRKYLYFVCITWDNW